MEWMQPTISIRPARADDARVLSDLAVRSKAHWGYSPQFMQACRDELTYTSEQLRDPGYFCFVGCRNDRIVGFYALSKIDSRTLDLEAMFVEPAAIGTGAGRALMDHAREQARVFGAEDMLIQADPYAEGFYRAMGAVPVGQRESDSIPGRMLPEMKLTVGG